MKRGLKIIAWTVGGIVGGIVLFFVGILVWIFLREVVFNPAFDDTKIYPDENRVAPADTIIEVNGLAIKMVGVKGGRIECAGLSESIDLDDFHIGETEVTQELWESIMGSNPSIHKGDSLPVENVSLVECMEFVHKLDSVSGHRFKIPTHPQWLYAAYLGKRLSGAHRELDEVAWFKENAADSTHNVRQKAPNGLGVYDMVGNVAEWTVSGSNPLFMVPGGSYTTSKDVCFEDSREYDHCDVKRGYVGLRLISNLSGIEK